MNLLVAINSKLNQINLLEFNSKDEVINMKKNGPFFCPICKNLVRLKIGQKKRAHFAHVDLIECKNERKETRQHIEGKYDLYQYFKRFNELVEVEKFIPEINQRPDLMIKFKNHTLYIEYQCSKIPLDVLIKRTESYQKLNHKILWILGESLLSQKYSFCYSLNEISIYCIVKSRSPELIFYNSIKKRFTILSSLIAFSSKLFVGKQTTILIDQCKLPQIFFQSIISKSDFVLSWCKLKKNYRKNQHLNYRGKFYLLKEILYKKQINYLPAVIGVPLASNYLINEHCILWQGILYFLFIHEMKLEEIIDLAELKIYFTNQIDNGSWRVNYFQKNGKIKLENCVENYIDFLEHFRILKRQKNGKIMKIANAIIPSSFQHALDEDYLTASTAFDLLFNTTSDSNDH